MSSMAYTLVIVTKCGLYASPDSVSISGMAHGIGIGIGIGIGLDWIGLDWIGNEIMSY